VPTSLGAHNARVDAARDLLTKKGRKQQQRFSFEGPTLLREARSAGVAIESIYATKAAYDGSADLSELESAGVAVYLVDERSMRRISDLETPPGIVAVAPLVLADARTLLQQAGVVLLLADIGDPGNAGTLLRTAEAFSARGVIVGSLGVEPHLPKVVRSGMGAVFRMPLAVTEPHELAGLLDGWQVTGLAADGVPLPGLAWSGRDVLAVGNERHGLGRWQDVCGRVASIPMRGNAESLNAAVAGAIALYEATKGLVPRG
jgi:TrmH family RNA methyltransferase